MSSKEKCQVKFCRNTWDGNGVWINRKWCCGRCWDKYCDKKLDLEVQE